MKPAFLIEGLRVNPVTPGDPRRWKVSFWLIQLPGGYWLPYDLDANVENEEFGIRVDFKRPAGIPRYAAEAIRQNVSFMIRIGIEHQPSDEIIPIFRGTKCQS